MKTRASVFWSMCWYRGCQPPEYGPSFCVKTRERSALWNASSSLDARSWLLDTMSGLLRPMGTLHTEQRNINTVLVS